MSPDGAVWVTQDPEGDERCAGAPDRGQQMPRLGGSLCGRSLRTRERFHEAVEGRPLPGEERLGVRELLGAGWAARRASWVWRWRGGHLGTPTA